MSRKAREKSSTGIYHIMISGLNRQNIFDDDEDYERFLQIVKDVKEICGFKLYSYCLMGNHCHLLLKTEQAGLEQIIKRIGIKYVYWYNTKNKRTGHLFQDRFKSEAVESDEYLLSVLKYIHQKPKQAKLCKKISEYKWSSYKEYTGKKKIIDTDYIYDLTDKKEFGKFHKTKTSEMIMDLQEKNFKLSDSEAKEIILKKIKRTDPADFKLFDRTDQIKYIREFREARISMRQINRLTGVSKGIIGKA